jgi:hypothetical protein
MWFSLFWVARRPMNARDDSGALRLEETCSGVTGCPSRRAPRPVLSTGQYLLSRNFRFFR